MLSHSSVSALSYRAAYHAVLPEALALSPGDVRTPKTSATSAVEAIVGKLPMLALLRERVAALPEFDMHAYDQLGPRAHALDFAVSACTMTAGMSPSLARDLAELRAASRDLVAESALLAARGVLPRQPIAALRFNGTRANNARNVGHLAGYLSNCWPQLAEHTRITRSELARVIALADGVHLALIKHGTRRENLRSPTELRLRIFSLVLSSLDEVEGAVRYLFRKDPAQIDRYLPRCYPQHARPRRAAERPLSSPAETAGKRKE